MGSGMTTSILEIKPEARQMVRTCPEEDSDYVGRWMLRMELPGRRPRGRSERRFMDAEGQKDEVSGTEEDAGDWRTFMEQNDSPWRPLKEKVERRRMKSCPLSFSSCGQLKPPCHLSSYLAARFCGLAPCSAYT